MLKLGICEVSQGMNGQQFWRRGLTAANLLAELTVGDGDALFERILRETSVIDGVARTTARCRFAALDEEVQKCLISVFPSGSQIDVEDWAVSSGITSAEWFKRLRVDYPAVQFTASDWALYLIEVRREGYREIFIVTTHGTPVQYISPPFVVSLVEPQHWFWLANRVVQLRALRKWRSLAAEFRIPERWNGLKWESGWMDASPFRLRQLSMLHPEVKQLCGTQFRVKRHSVSTPLATQVDAIRTMNILNRAYFSDEDLKRAAACVHYSLKRGGVWIVGRTVCERSLRSEATVLQKLEEGWKRLLRIGPGSEMELLVHFNQ